jgi:hypothetical protein
MEFSVDEDNIESTLDSMVDEKNFNLEDLDYSFDEENFDVIIRDVTRKISKASIDENDLNGIQMMLKKKKSIKKKPYTIYELDQVVADLKKQITKTKFSKKDLIDISKQIKIDRIRKSNSLNPLDNLSGLPVQDQIIVVIKLIIRTFLKLFEDFVVLLVTVMIVLNLQFRAKVPSSLLYPSDPNAYPYVYFDPNNRSQQSTLTSMVELNTKDSEDDVFLDTPAYFTSDGKYSLDKNVCKINNPHGTGQDNKCSSDADPEYTKHFTDNISYENMSFFAKQFIQTNSSKTSNDLNLYGLLTYLMLYISCFTNENMANINETFNSLFKQEGGQSLSGYMIFFVLVVLLYSTFQSSKYTFSNLIQKLIFTTKEGGVLNKFNFLGSFMNILSGFFSPVLFFFKIFLVLLYPIVLFHCFFGYMRYSTLTSSIFTKLFCYFGVAFTLGNAISYALLFSQVLMKKHRSLDDVFEEIIKSFVSMMEEGMAKLTIFQKAPSFEMPSFEMPTSVTSSTGKYKKYRESFVGKGVKGIKNVGKKIGDGAKDVGQKIGEGAKDVGQKIGKGAKDVGQKIGEGVKDVGQNIGEGVKNIGKGGGGGGGGGSNNFGGFSNLGRPSFDSCIPPSFFEFTFLKSILKYLGMLVFSPIIIMMFAIPAFVSLSMAFSFTKSVTIDYMKYIGKLICEVGNYKTMIRVMFYIITIMEIVKYMKQKFRGITTGVLVVVLLADMVRDFIKKGMVANKCNMEGNEA